MFAAPAKNRTMVATLLVTLIASGCRVTLPLSDRYDFAQRCQTLRTGMTEAEVRSVLGKPDEVTSESIDPADGWTEENFWRYGVVRPGGMAGYGTLYFEKGKLYDYRPPEIPSRELPPESELKQLLQTIDDGARQGSLWQPSDDRPPSFNPLPIVRAENALIALGREQALRVLHEYIRVCSINGVMDPRGEGAYCLVQTVFEPSKGDVVDGPGLGQVFPRPPKQKASAPYWPNVVSGGVPYSLYGGSVILGSPEPIDRYLDRLEKSYRFRTTPLIPSNTPWDIDKRLWTPEETNELEQDEMRRKARWQVLNLVATAYRHDIDFKATDPDFVLGFDDRLWERQISGMKAAGIHWDWQRQMYVRGDGSTIAEMRAYSIHPKRYWRPRELAPVEGYIALQRVNDRNVRIDVDRNGDENAWKGASIRVLSEAKEPLGWTGNKRNGGVRSTVADIPEHIRESISARVAPGQKVILELTRQGKTITTPPIDIDAPTTVR